MTVVGRPRSPADRPDPDSRHGPVAQLLIAWSPLSLILAAYAVAAWVSAPIGLEAGSANRLGIPLHVAGPADADRLLLGGIPSVWLQARLLDGGPHWYDGVAALVYVTHFLVFPVMTALVWFRLRSRFGAWLTALLAFTVLGVAGYVGYPAAPPWLASDLGVVGPVRRISDLGWDYLHLPWLGGLVGAGQADSNPVAAMPSLHAGSVLLMALFLWPLAGRWSRLALVALVVAMAAALVYTGEHYVVDVVAGWLVAAVAVLLARVVRPRPNGPVGPASGLSGGFPNPARNGPSAP